MKLFNFNCDPKDIEALHAVARDEGTCAASIMRRLIKQELRRAKKERREAA